jgi:hypothetical protein
VAPPLFTHPKTLACIAESCRAFDFEKAMGEGLQEFLGWSPESGDPPQKFLKIQNKGFVMRGCIIENRIGHLSMVDAIAKPAYEDLVRYRDFFF